MFVFKPSRNQEFIDLFKMLVKFYNPACYVEVGVQKGYTFNQLATEGIARMIGIDTVKQHSVVKGDHIEFYETDTDGFVELVKRGEVKEPQIDLLFIDANHEKSHVLKDFDNMSPFVATGHGIVLLHDTHPNSEHFLAPEFCNNAHEAARKLFKDKKYKDWEVFTFPGPFAGMTMMRYAKHHFCWDSKYTEPEKKEAPTRRARRL